MCLLMFEHRIATSVPSWWSLHLHCNLHRAFFRAHDSLVSRICGWLLSRRETERPLWNGVECMSFWLEWCFFQCPRSVKMVGAILEAEDRNLLNLEQVCSSRLYANNSHKGKHIVILHLCPSSFAPQHICCGGGHAKMIWDQWFSAFHYCMEMGKPLQSGVPKWRLLLYNPISSNQIVYYSYIL
jgi:hypothetical protein